MYFHHFVIIYPWKRAGSFIWTNLNPLHPRMLCAKFGWNWPSGSGEEDEHVKSLQTDRQTDGQTDGQTDAGRQVIRKAHLSFQLRWAKNGKCFWRWITRSWVIILIFSIVLQLVKKKSCLTREINSIFNVKPLNALYYPLNKSDIFRGRYIQTVKISKLLFLQCENTCTKRLLHVLHAMHCMECFRFLKKVYWFNLTHETWFKKKIFHTSFAFVIMSTTLSHSWYKFHIQRQTIMIEYPLCTFS